MRIEDRVLIVSEVGEKDGIGIEVYRSDKLLIEIFRRDSKRTRTISLYEKDLPLDLIEKYIAVFKKEIPWDFMD